jgi:cobalt-zinc-cadmium efflux system outer membrane protein
MNRATHIERSLHVFMAMALFCLAPPEWAFAQDAGKKVAVVTLSLVEAERMMLARNREIQIARRAQEAARADTMTAGQAPNPTLTLQTLNINPQRGIGAGGPRDKIVDSTVRIDQVIERGEKRELRQAAAQRIEVASDADFADVRRQQRLVLHNAYYDLALAQQKNAVLADTAALFSRSLDAAELRLKAGDISTAELARLKVDAMRAVNDARSAQADLVRAQLALFYIVGSEDPAQPANAALDPLSLRADDTWPQPGAEAASVAISQDLIDRRPDVRAAQARVEAFERSRELARRLRTRDISVGMQYEHFPSGPLDGTGNSYGVGISIPLFVRHAYGGEIRRAEVEYDAARDALDRVRAVASGELARASSDLKSSAERVRRYNGGLLAEAKRAADAAEYAYKNGAIGIMDLLDSRRTLRAIQIDAATAQADFAKALAAWQSSQTTKDD